MVLSLPSAETATTEVDITATELTDRAIVERLHRRQSTVEDEP